MLRPGYTVAVPYNAKTYTYEAGPQLNYRRLKKLTFFVRPALGALHAKFESKPADPISSRIVTSMLHGRTSTSDTLLFYGFGGGVTWELNPNLGIRVPPTLLVTISSPTC